MLVQGVYSKTIKLVDYDKTTLGTEVDHLCSVDRLINDKFIVCFSTMDACVKSIELSKCNVFANGKPMFYVFFNNENRCKDKSGAVITNTAVLVVIMPADNPGEEAPLKKSKKSWSPDMFKDGTVIRVSSLGGNPEYFCTDSEYDHEVQCNTGIDKKYTFGGKTIRLRTSAFKLVRAGTKKAKK